MLATLRREPTDRAPFWFMRQAGRYLPEYRATRAEAGSFLDLCYDPVRATEVTLQPIRRFGMDAAILFSDILVIPHALGQSVAFREGEGPVLDPVRNCEALSRLSLDHIHDRLSPVYETVDRLSSALPAETTLIGFAGAPWTVATYMVAGKGTADQAAAKDWSFRDPEGFADLIDLVTEATIQYLRRQIEAGAEVIQIFDTWSGSLPPSGFARWCIEPTRKIVDAIRQSHAHIPVIGFPRGAGGSARRYAEETGVDGLSLDTSVPTDWAARELQPHVVTQGNLDPRLVIAGGDAMLRDARKILEDMKGGPHIFNLGHGFVPETPPEHVETLSKLLRGEIS